MIALFERSTGNIFIQAPAVSEILQNRSFFAPSYRSFRHAPAVSPAVIPLSQTNRNAQIKMALAQDLKLVFCASVDFSMRLAANILES